MKRLVLPLVLAAAACAPGGADVASSPERANEREALRWIHRLDEPAIYARVVALKATGALKQATDATYPEPVRIAAVRALGEVDTTDADAHLETLAKSESGNRVGKHARAVLDGVDLAVQEQLAKARSAAEARRKELEDAVRSGPDRVDAVWRALERGERELVTPVASDDDPIVRAHARAALAGTPRAKAQAEIDAHAKAEQSARDYLPMLANPAVRDTLVERGAVWTLVEATKKDHALPVRRQAVLGLGRVKDRDDVARDRLIHLVQAQTPDPATSGQMKLYAAVGLTMRADPGTAVDLLLALSSVDPNDNVKALADEGVQGPYYTVDAQICDALLRLGVWYAEEDLIDQMKRRAWVRVLIDAHAVLRRETGLTLPFDYNGSYERRDRQAEAWRKELRKTRPLRYANRALDTNAPYFRKRLEDILAWLRGRSVNNRYIAERVLLRLDRYAVPALLAELDLDQPIAQRQAALMLGRIGDPSVCEKLRTAVGHWSDPDAIARGLEALRALRDAGAPRLGRVMLKHDDAEVRAQAAALLGTLRDKDSRAALEGALGRERLPATATKLRCALLLVGDTSMVEPLLKAFVEADQPSREAAYAALTEHAGKAPAVDPLASIEERRKAAAEFPKK